MQTGVGLVVRPKRGRAVLMDQDVLHRVSAPSAAAGGRPRYSLVWKLVQSILDTALICKLPPDAHEVSQCQAHLVSHDRTGAANVKRKKALQAGRIAVNDP